MKLPGKIWVPIREVKLGGNYFTDRIYLKDPKLVHADLLATGRWEVQGAPYVPEAEAERLRAENEKLGKINAEIANALNRKDVEFTKELGAVRRNLEDATELVKFYRDVGCSKEEMDKDESRYQEFMAKLKAGRKEG